MQSKTKYEIQGHEGQWIIENSWISDLGYIMIRFYNLDKKTWMNVNTRTTVEEAFNLPWVTPTSPEETNPPDTTTIY